jgi:hypothetical protein
LGRPRNSFRNELGQTYQTPRGLSRIKWPWGQLTDLPRHGQSLAGPG